jgi:beta-lactamase class D
VNRLGSGVALNPSEEVHWHCKGGTAMCRVSEVLYGWFCGYIQLQNLEI